MGPAAGFDGKSSCVMFFRLCSQPANQFHTKETFPFHGLMTVCTGQRDKYVH